MRCSRRALLSLAAAAVSVARPARAVGVDHGRLIPPLDLPDVALTLHDGTATRLPELLRGRAAAIQPMLPTCTVTCPLGAAAFAGVQDLLPEDLEPRPLLVSVDMAPQGDPAPALAAWLRRFHARPGWVAAVPDPSDPAALPALRAAFGTRDDPADPHADQVAIVSRSGTLVWRTYELPSAEDIATLLIRA